MIRKMIINALYDTASLLCRVADALSPTSDEVWRGRAWDQWNDRNEAAVAESYYAPAEAAIRATGWDNKAGILQIQWATIIPDVSDLGEKDDGKAWWLDNKLNVYVHADRAFHVMATWGNGEFVEPTDDADKWAAFNARLEEFKSSKRIGE